MRKRLRKKLSKFNIEWIDRNKHLFDKGYCPSRLARYEKFYLRLQRHRANRRWWRTEVVPFVRKQDWR